ncbi:vegetative cell wall protein gp1-like [Iris pallida]|uniref:Vegetative cell wall protein gp1-like n=1 Tax=Iris pallida TaxID=29817 RepID=A0AAX6FH31_IRIPA|nr:vegetative cell wall protein gp1-like [Iris pallida]
MRWHEDNFEVSGACTTPEWLHPRPWLKQGAGSGKPRCRGELGRRSREGDTGLGTAPGMGRGSSVERLPGSSEKAAVASLGSDDRRGGRLGRSGSRRWALSSCEDLCYFGEGHTCTADRERTVLRCRSRGRRCEETRLAGTARQRKPGRGAA